MDSGLNSNRVMACAGLTILIIFLALLVWLVVTMESPEPTPQPEPLPRPFTVEVHHIWLPLVKRAPTKKGVCLTYGNCDDVLAIGGSWCYSYGPRPKPCAGVESVPMIWGRESIGTEVSGTSKYLLGFNEPDRWNQADLTPSEAAELWRDVELLYGGDWLLVSPAVSHTAVEWLEQFYGAYLHRFGRKPVLDALAVHCYANDVDECIATVQEVIAMADDWQVLGGVWLTEFAFWPVGAEGVPIALGKARSFIEWLGGERRVARFAWFAARIQGSEWWAPNVSAPLVAFESGELTMYGLMYGEH